MADGGEEAYQNEIAARLDRLSKMEEEEARLIRICNDARAKLDECVDIASELTEINVQTMRDVENLRILVKNNLRWAGTVAILDENTEIREEVCAIRDAHNEAAGEQLMRLI